MLITKSLINKCKILVCLILICTASITVIYSIPVSNISSLELDSSLSYIVYVEDSTVYAVSEHSGTLLISGSNASEIIQVAIDRGENIYIKAGQYNITTLITVTEDNKRIHGDGYSTFLKAHTETAILKVSGTLDDWTENVIIEDLRIEGYETGRDTMIEFVHYVRNSGVEGCFIDHAGYDGILFEKHVENCFIIRNVVRYSRDDNIDLFHCVSDILISQNVAFGAVNDGIHVAESRGVWGVSNVIVSENICLYNGYAGIRVWQSSDVTVTGNECRFNKYGVKIDGGLRVTVQGNVLTDSSYSNIHGYGVGEQIIVNGNILYNATGFDGITFWTGNHIIITDNIINTSGRHGMKLYKGINNLIVKNNIVLNSDNIPIYIKGTNIIQEDNIIG